MYIQKVKLQNFRSFGDEGICFLFNKGINAVIGENNNGKTALINSGEKVVTQIACHISVILDGIQMEN